LLEGRTPVLLRWGIGPVLPFRVQQVGEDVREAVFVRLDPLEDGKGACLDAVARALGCLMHREPGLHVGEETRGSGTEALMMLGHGQAARGEEGSDRIGVHGELADRGGSPNTLTFRMPAAASRFDQRPPQSTPTLRDSDASDIW